MFDVVFKVVSMASGIGIFVGVMKLLIWAIRLEPRIEHVEMETAGHGSLIQQIIRSHARIEGFLEALTERFPHSSKR